MSGQEVLPSRWASISEWSCWLFGYLYKLYSCTCTYVYVISPSGSICFLCVLPKDDINDMYVSWLSTCWLGYFWQLIDQTIATFGDLRDKQDTYPCQSLWCCHQSGYMYIFPVSLYLCMCMHNSSMYVQYLNIRTYNLLYICTHQLEDPTCTYNVYCVYIHGWPKIIVMCLQVGKLFISSCLFVCLFVCVMCLC